MNLWLLHKELEMMHLPAENFQTCQMQVCRAITESFNRGELATNEAIEMITEILKPF